MITNQREYETRKAFAAGMEETVARADVDLAGQHPLLAEAMRQGQRALLAEARAEIAEYEALRDGRLTLLRFDALPEIGLSLIRARIAQGLTQQALADRLGLKQQQIQRYEVTRYATARIDRLQAVATALGVTLRVEAIVPSVSLDAQAGVNTEATSGEHRSPAHAAGLP
jgi:hypothetical protein